MKEKLMLAAVAALTLALMSGCAATGSHEMMDDSSTTMHGDTMHKDTMHDDMMKKDDMKSGMTDTMK